MLLLFLICFTGCGKTKDETRTSQLDKEHIYKEEELTLILKNNGLSDVQQIIKKGDRLYLRGSYHTDDYSYQESYKFASVQLDGSDGKSFALSDSIDESITDASDASETEDSAVQESDDSATENISYISMAVTPNDHFLILKNHYTEKSTDDTWITENHYSLVEYDQDGNLIIEEQIIPGPSPSDDEYYSLFTMSVDKNGTLYMIEYDKQIAVYNSKLQRMNTISFEDISSLNNLYLLSDSVYVSAWDTEYEHMLVYKIEENGTAQPRPIQMPSGGNFFAGDDKYDFYVVNDKEIRGWNQGDEESTEVLDFIDSDTAVSYVDHVVSISENEFLILFSDSYDYTSRLSKFTKVDPKDVKEKQSIDLACRYLDESVKKQVIAYNKKNDKYRIQVRDYSVYDSNADYNAGQIRMNNDIASGKIPDIFLLNDSMPIDSYIEKQMFEDLSIFIENDQTFSKEQFATNVIDVFSEKGKWYCLVPSFSIQTYAGKESVVGSETNWRIEDVQKVMSSFDGRTLINEATKDSILNEGLQYMGSNFIDWEHGICKFDSPEFISFLEFANSFPSEITMNEEEQNDYWANYETQYRENKTILMYLYLSDISTFNYQEKGMIGEKLSFVGFPTISGTGSYIVPSLQLAISSESKAKEGAWEFLRYFLSDEYQTSDELYNLPISLKALEQKIEKAQQKPYYLDESGNKVEYDETYNYDGGEIVITPITKERSEELKRFILSVDNRSSQNEEISSIIREEAGSFFLGQKTVKEVAEVIQSRVQIYVREHM